MAILVKEDVLWEVHDNYQKQTYRNRYHICTDQGVYRLSIPIKHVGGSDGRQKYADVKLDNSYPWQKQHWRTIQTAYRTSPFFEFYEDELAPLFEKDYSFLLDFNWDTIIFLTDALQIEMNPKKTKTYMDELTRGVDARFLVNAKREVAFQQKPYVQVFAERHGFIQNTSTLDLLFNEGTNALAYLKQHIFDF